MKGIFSSAPLFLFLLLLLVLAISAHFGKATVLQKEGFLRFSGNSPLLGTVNISDYMDSTNPSSQHPVIKLYDNIYFDPNNANLVELGGRFLSRGNAEVVGTSVTSLSVYDRDGGIHGPYNMVVNDNVPEASISKITPNYSIYMVNSKLSDVNPLVIYASWNSDTFLHVFDLSTNRAPTSVLSAYFPINSPVKSRYYAWNAASNKLRNSNKTVLSDIGTSSVADGKDGQGVSVPLYDPSKTPFQLCKNTYYDYTNGNLIFKKNNGSISVYNRPFTSSTSYSDPKPKSYTSRTPMKKSSSKITTSGYYPMVISHPNNKFAVYYVANGSDTLLAVLANRGGTMNMVYSYFYKADGSRIMTKGQIMPPPGRSRSSSRSTASKTNAKTNAKTSARSKVDMSGTDLSNYYNWLAFWTTVAGAKDKDAVFKASNYIPKSAVVPPVCPSCAYCSGGQCGGGVCTNCGGKGGYGTSGTGSGYRFGDYLSKFGSGTKDLLEDAGSGATNLAKDTVKGTVGLAKETVGGAIGLAREAGSGVAGMFKSNPMQIRETGYGRQDSDRGSGDSQERGGSGTYRLPEEPLGLSKIDPYSYNGALVSKGGNYIPITTDFSAFGK